MNTALLKEYALNEEKLKSLEAKKEELREQIVNEMKVKKVDKVESDLGLFTIGRRLSWKFTEAVKKIEEKLKIAKAKEQEKGIATSSVTEYLVFTKPKE